MTGKDIAYIQYLLRLSKLHSPLLELGAGYGGITSKEVVQASGLEYKTSDIADGPGIDYVANFEADDCARSFPSGVSFGSILVLNVLEHVFEPIKVLDNSLQLIRTGGTVVVITPSMWPVHNYPQDCQRLLPDWYLKYAESRHCRLCEDCFEFLGWGKTTIFFNSNSGARQLPPPTKNKFHLMYSRAIHKIFNTSGRGMWTANHTAIGAVFEKLE